jgi:hypothetical protein
MPELDHDSRHPGRDRIPGLSAVPKDEAIEALDRPLHLSGDDGPVSRTYSSPTAPGRPCDDRRLQPFPDGVAGEPSRNCGGRAWFLTVRIEEEVHPRWVAAAALRRSSDGHSVRLTNQPDLEPCPRRPLAVARKRCLVSGRPPLGRRRPGAEGGIYVAAWRLTRPASSMGWRTRRPAACLWICQAGSTATGWDRSRYAATTGRRTAGGSPESSTHDHHGGKEHRPQGADRT